MEYKNKLRIHRDEIKQYFVHEFAGIGDDIDYYVNVSLPLKWLTNYGSRPIKKINVADYEETLIKFIENPDNILETHPVLIIVGAAGTGKSTSIKYALSKAQVCNGCPCSDICAKNYPSRIHLDFLSFKREAEVYGDVELEETSSHKEAIDRFWSYISKKLNIVINNGIETTEEVTKFWLWLLYEAPEGRHSHIFNKRLEAILHLIKHPNENSAELLRKRAEFYANFTEHELVYYKLYQVSYLRRTQKVNCNLLIFDNIDRLEPYLQADIINFTLEANTAFGCKAIIPMRPNTFHLNRDASDCIEIIEHCVPNIKDVLEKRLRKYRNKGDKEVYYFMKRIIEYITETNIMREVYYSTSGSSIRFAVRNLYNFFLSPLIITHEDDKPLPFIEFDVNTFFQAFFCTESSEEKLYESTFVNILSIRRNEGNIEFSNIKLRALYLLYSNKEIKSEVFISHLESFGHSISDVLLVVNEFLDNKKSLMWSNAVSEYVSIGKLRNCKGHMFYITPMGDSYFETLITHPSYLRECIYALENVREIYLSPSMNKLISTVKTLFYNDLSEIRTYCGKQSVSEYRNIFPSDKPSITAILFYKMYANFEILVRNIKTDQFDNYGNFIVHEVNKLLASDDTIND